MPLPDFIKTPCSKVLGSITSKLVTKSVEYFMPGIHLLLNVLIDFYNGRLDLKQFENPSFYKSLEERNESDKTSKYGDEIPKFSKFSYKYEKKYDTEETIRNEKILIIANKNVHWCLEKLYRINKIDAETMKSSKIVLNQLKSLKKLYEIEEKNVGKDASTQHKIKAIDENWSVEQIEEFCIRLLLLEPKIKNYLEYNKSVKIVTIVNIEKKSYEIPNSLIQNCNNIDYIQRDKLHSTIIKAMENNTITVTNKNKITVLSAIGGSGKTCLANAIGQT